MALGFVVKNNVILPPPLTGNLLNTLDNPNPYGTSASDAFGYDVAICDSYAIVGAYNEDEEGMTGSGKVYIFNPSTGALLRTLDNPNAYGTSFADGFGSRVAICDSYAIACASQEDEASRVASGKAYIFNPSTGALLYTLDNPNAYGTAADDVFGTGVAICDSYAIVGAPAEDDAGGSSSGKAYIFNPSTGALLHTLNNPNAYGTSNLDYFGANVGICDSYAIVSAYNEDDADGLGSGKAYIFNPATGALLHTLNNPNAYGTSESDAFGTAVAICDSYAIVSAMSEDDAGGAGSGKAYIFDTSTGALLHTLNNPNAYGTTVGDNFGSKVAICESYAIVGAPAEDDADGTGSGKAYVFNPATGALLYTLDNPNAYSTSANDGFGSAVSVCNSYIIVGAQLEDDAAGLNSGKAYIFN